jgi:molecular chaperone GrpE
MSEAERPSAAAGTPDHPPKDTMPSLEELLRQAELAAEEHKDAWLRAKAEADNVRKRAQTDVAAAHKFAIERFASELLIVKDSLEAAVATSATAPDALKNGVELTLKQLAAAFERFQIAEINPAGQKFNPHEHQAMTAVEADAEPNTVLQVLQKGYRLHDRVIRPALVTVAKAKTVENARN